MHVRPIRFNRRLIAVVSGALLGASTPALAQIAGAVDIGGGLGQVPSSAWLRESSVAPMLRATHRAGFLQVDAAAVERGGSLSLRRSAFEGSVNSPAFGVFRIALAGHYLQDASQPVAHATSASVTGALSAKLGSSGVWVGTSRPRSAPLQLNLGAWRVLGSAIVSISNQSQSMRVGGPWSRTFTDSTFNDTTQTWNKFDRTVADSTGSRLQRWSDLEARVDWSRGRLTLSAAMSGRRSRDSVRAMTWGRINAAMQLRPFVSLIAGGGTLPAAGGSGVSTSRFATLGVRLAPAALLRQPLPPAVRPAASAFSLQRISAGTYKITLRVPNARTVELSGDFNQWTPISLRETAPNVWEGTLAFSPGTHRVNVRVDGDAWTAPPGLPAIDDEFSGRVGILIVR